MDKKPSLNELVQTLNQANDLIKLIRKQSKHGGEMLELKENYIRKLELYAATISRYRDEAPALQRNLDKIEAVITDLDYF